MPTIEEIAQYEVHKNMRDFDHTIYVGKEVKQIAIAVAKFHVEAALKAVNEDLLTSLGQNYGKSILNVYPLTNIK